MERLLGIWVAGRWFLLHAALLQHKKFIVWGIIRLLSIQPHGLKPGSIQRLHFWRTSHSTNICTYGIWGLLWLLLNVDTIQLSKCPIGMQFNPKVHFRFQ